MQFSIDAIRNFSIQDMESYREMLLQENDYDSMKWCYTTFIDMNNYLKKTNMNQEEIQELLSVSREGISFGSVTKRGMLFIHSLTNPRRCLELVETYKLMERTHEHVPNMKAELQWLKDRWEKGFYIFVNQ
ncbi:hypothetical protein [Bacillus toyonensis]|uniref:Uncharacterized protein n=1 Tax=Bacillus toyonensis TaxID=155322 RepID=A0A2B6PZ31_9BACI|nr:hypothetical protein [Bacillus toyonensis]PEJ84074.1 hypothetical protein CN688_30905 [Bacillus toyonensis]PEK74865.1 hypothetical protein CN594_32400 [Bacillus toyonensis]PEL19308.1 hypothetical protein CN624_28380 [Bacillus toyonensis]PEO51839.1 hypothetical protein CN579_27275 [Bacillus toyonensis]PFY36375.1 hypothetical protein COL54_26565 [Bacillus toyonensis]